MLTKFQQMRFNPLHGFLESLWIAYYVSTGYVPIERVVDQCFHGIGRYIKGVGSCYKKPSQVMKRKLDACGFFDFR